MSQSTFYRIDPPSNVTLEQLEARSTCYGLAQPLCRGKRVLELDRGVGLALRLAGDAASLVVGRWDETMLAAARGSMEGLRNVEVRLLDLGRLECASESLDTIVFSHGLDGLPAPEPFLKEAFRVLKPGGHLLICTTNAEWEGFESAPPPRAYSAERLARVLVHGGFYPRLFRALSGRTAAAAPRRPVTSARKLAWRLSGPPGGTGQNVDHVQLVERVATDSGLSRMTLVELSGDQTERCFKTLYAVAAVDKWPPLGVPL